MLRFYLILMLSGIATVAQAVSGTPLVVVRYNQPKVFYQKPLYNAISRAVAIKPNVAFNIVSFVPPASNMAQAERETSRFVSDLTQMGIPSNRIHVERQAANDSANHEIYLYVD